MDRANIQESLEELEGDRWPEPAAGATRLMCKAHEAHSKPASQLSIEDLRLLIGQKVSLSWAVPFAVAAMEKDPLAEGDMYPGDLLNACLSLPDSYFAEHLDVRDRLRAVATRISDDDWRLAFQGRFREWR